ncbi:peptidase inhibitor family I36 protein [Hamadaea tsunoensis]|uniref:peptidase inhibitor family I36 protein n=1 Tax=Hamadaea tsunoensis TaxID=53368 RepID=UPI0004082867|nr:peptidase inhibitor family I36 protein [Hamadaea tsunoensis]
MNVKRTLVRSAAALAAVGLGAVAAAQPAAAAGYASCTKGKSCYYTSQGGGGSKWEAPSPGNWVFANTVWYENISSFDNMTAGGDVYFYDRNNYQIFHISTGVYGGMPYNADNKTSWIHINW